MQFVLIQTTDPTAAVKKVFKGTVMLVAFQVFVRRNRIISIAIDKMILALDYKPICQYNEDCPPNKLCDRLNRICINPCFEDSCGENAECLPKDHGIDCQCLHGFQGNPYVECVSVQGCRSDEQCPQQEACINAQCISPCKCGSNAICEVIYHKAQCKCPPGYQGNPLQGCQPPRNPCDPNPCGQNALCELDNGSPICFCPKGLTGNPFKNCSKYH